MSTKYPQLKVEKRKLTGRKVKSLRKEGILVANLYGKEIKSLALQLPQKDFLKIFGDVGETGLVELVVTGEKKPRVVLVHNLQREPVDQNLIHIDFRQVDLKQKITAMVPVEMLGEAPGVAAGGVLVQLLNEIEVEALPADLPEKLTVKIAPLAKIGDTLAIENLIYDKTKVRLKVEDSKALVVKIEAPAKEEVEVKPAAEAVPAEGEAAKPEEGEKPAEGAKPTEAKPKEESKAEKAAEAPKKEEKK